MIFTLNLDWRRERLGVENVSIKRMKLGEGDVDMGVRKGVDVKISDR